MGGFVFDTSDADINFLPNSRQRLTLTPQGLLFLIEHEPDLVPDLSKEHICDKSKASNLAKTLVCLQALWFCAQCIVRVAQGLAVSLLELNVFGHAICALLMYILWWDKPLDIEEPTVLSGKMVREICAFMCMRSFPVGDAVGRVELPHGVRYGDDATRNARSIAETSVLPDENYGRPKWYRLDKVCVELAKDLHHDIMVSQGRPPREEPIQALQCRIEWNAAGSVDGQNGKLDQYTSYFVKLDCPGDAGGLADSKTAPLSRTPAMAANRIIHESLDKDPPKRPSIPHASSITTNSIDGLCLMLGEWCEGASSAIGEPDTFFFGSPKPDYAPAYVTLSTADVLRWRLCSRAPIRYCRQPERLRKSSTPSYQEFPAYRSVYDRSPNWPSSHHLEFTEGNRGQPSLAMLLGFTFAGLVYGGLHLLAWDVPFPSQLDIIFWRGSGLLLASSGFVYTLYIALDEGLKHMLDSIPNTSSRRNIRTRSGRWYRRLKHAADAILVVAYAIVYLVARAYLVVESFLQLAHLPDPAYALPAWSQYYLHITVDEVRPFAGITKDRTRAIQSCR